MTEWKEYKLETVPSVADSLVVEPVETTDREFFMKGIDYSYYNEANEDVEM